MQLSEGGSGFRKGQFPCVSEFWSGLGDTVGNKRQRPAVLLVFHYH